MGHGSSKEAGNASGDKMPFTTRALDFVENSAVAVSKGAKALVKNYDAFRENVNKVWTPIEKIQGKIEEFHKSKWDPANIYDRIHNGYNTFVKEKLSFLPETTKLALLEPMELFHDTYGQAATAVWNEAFEAESAIFHDANRMMHATGLVGDDSEAHRRLEHMKRMASRFADDFALDQNEAWRSMRRWAERGAPKQEFAHSNLAHHTMLASEHHEAFNDLHAIHKHVTRSNPFFEGNHHAHPPHHTLVPLKRSVIDTAYNAVFDGTMRDQLGDVQPEIFNFHINMKDKRTPIQQLGSIVLRNNPWLNQAHGFE